MADKQTLNAKAVILRALAGASLAALSGCGGGSGGGGGVISTPAPAPAPSPTPSPSPTPTSTANFDTAEYRQSDGPRQHNAVTAWQQGATGEGVSIAVIDTGIDSDSPEFAGRIAPESQDVAGNRGIESPDGHGTQVAMVAAAARDNKGVMGIAFDATVLALRADQPGTCASFDPTDSSTGCSFLDSDIARGVDVAIAAGAKVVNLSLGGSLPTAELVNAIDRAAQAGIVVVVSAGNDGESTDPGIDAAQPDPFASGVLFAAPQNVIIVGSVDASNTISSFSNRAGSQANAFITARGEDLCCVYENGEIYTQVEGGIEYIYVNNGTSFSAPQVAGAAALLAQAFPNLTGAEIVELILGGAADIGAAGIDAVYGVGLLDIAGSFAPQGRTALAGTATAVALGDGAGVTSPAMGDAVRRASIGTVVLDKYDRAYGVDLGALMASARVEPRLYRAISGRVEGLSVTNGSTSLAFTVDPGSVNAATPVPLRLNDENARKARLLAVRIGAKIAPDTEFAFALREGAQGLEAGLSGHSRPAFLVAGEGAGELGFVPRRDGAVAVRRGFGDFGVTASVETGKAWSDSFERGLISRGQQDDFTRYGAMLDWAGGDVTTSLGASLLAERRTVLGARFSDAIGADGADSVFLDAAVGWQPSALWFLGVDYRRGFTDPRTAGLIDGASGFQTSAWSFDVQRQGLFASGDALGLRFAQPLRVEGGGLSLNVPTAYDYSSETATFGQRSFSLEPTGREITGEVRWIGPWMGGNLTASLFYRRDPGHIADLPDDKGAALRWSARF